MALLGPLCLLEVVSIGSLSPLFALPAQLSVPGCSHPCLARGSLHCPAKRGRDGSFHPPDSSSFFLPLQLPAFSLMPCTEAWSSLRLCLPKPAHLQYHREPSSPPHTPSPQHEMDGLLISPRKPRPPAAAAKMLPACIPGWEPKQPEQQRFGESNDIQRAEAACNKDCGTGKESSIRLYFGALRLSVPTGPSSSLKPLPYPLCFLFTFTCYPINSPFSCAPAVALSSDHCTGAINPLDCIRL